MIWSLTPFFNELDVLEIRLAQLDDLVDVHVLAESTHTFTGGEKPLHFKTALESGRFDRWADKIRYVVVDDLPEGSDNLRPSERFQASKSINWVRENLQRDALIRGCQGLHDDDLVLLSDLDEIPSNEIIERMDFEIDTDDVTRVYLPQHVMYLNWRWREPVVNAVCRFTDGSKLKRIGPQGLREFEYGRILSDRQGWHFSYMGGAEAIQYKIKSFSHSELNEERWTDLDSIRDRMANGHDMFGRVERQSKWVPIETLPVYVQENAEKFAHLMIDKPR